MNGYAVIDSRGKFVVAFATELECDSYKESHEWTAPAGVTWRVLPLVDGHAIEITLPAAEVAA